MGWVKGVAEKVVGRCREVRLRFDVQKWVWDLMLEGEARG